MIESSRIPSWINKKFDQIWREILRRDPIPNLEECYSLIR